MVLEESLPRIEAESEAGTAIELRDVTRVFARAGGHEVRAVDGISLDVPPGEFLVLLGPSGCGKTTLLRCIAGLETPASGSIRLTGRTVFSDQERVLVPPERRGIGMMFQSYALWPHMTVYQNVEYPLRTAKVPKGERRSRIEAVLESVGCGELGGQYPGKLSGGQQQRVALARALVARPAVLLFDEPLSNVDAKVREELRAELLRVQREVGFTAIYVTHDQSEAMELGDRVAVLRAGKIAQIDTPRAVYDDPASLYVANFVGSGNELEATVVSADTSGFAATLSDGQTVSFPTSAGEFAVGAVVRIFWRPEDCSLTPRDEEPGSDVVCFDTHVIARRFLPVHDMVVCGVGEHEQLRVNLSRTIEIDEARPQRLCIRAARVKVFEAPAPTAPADDDPNGA